MSSVVKYGIIATLIIWVLSLVTCTGHIQEDLTQKTAKTLESAGVGEEDFNIKASGRDLKVLVKDKTENERLEYERIINEQAKGVRVAKVDASLEERGRQKLDEEGYDWAKLSHNQKENLLTVSGDTIDADAPDKIVSHLKALDDAGEVISEVKVWPAYDSQSCQQALNTLSQSHIIEFEVDSAEIIKKLENENLLYELSVTMRRCPESKIEVAGHTDSSGDESYNIALSEKRAQAVLAYLKQLAVHPERLSAVGFGSSQPLVSNDNEENRQKNRRIEFKIIAIGEE